MASTDQWRKQFTKYKADVKKRGKPFYPYAMFHDTVMSLVVVSVIIGLAAVWYFTSGPGPQHVRQRRLLPARAALLRARRSGDDELRPTAGLVLLLPLLSPPHLQVARLGHSRHGRHPHDHADHRLPAPVHRPADGAAAHSSACRRHRRDPGHPLDGRPDVQRRNREGGARERGRPGGADLGADGRGSATTRTRLRAPRSSRARAARPVIPTSAPAARTRARPTSAPKGRRATRKTFS